MSTMILPIATTDGERTLTAVPAGQFAVHRTPACDNPHCHCATRPRWTITHIGTGRALALCRTGPEALTLARAWDQAVPPHYQTLDDWRACALYLSTMLAGIAADQGIRYVWAQYIGQHQ